MRSPVGPFDNTDNECNYLSMLRLKLNHVSKRGLRHPIAQPRGHGIGSYWCGAIVSHSSLM